MRRFVVLLVLVALLAIAGIIAIPAMAMHTYGSPSPHLTAMQVLQYSARLLWDDGLLTRPLDPQGKERAFTVPEGEPVESLAGRLKQEGAIRDAGALRDYLI